MSEEVPGPTDEGLLPPALPAALLRGYALLFPGDRCEPGELAGESCQRFGVDPVASPNPLPVPTNQAIVPEPLQMVGDQRLGEPELSDQIRDGGRRVSGEPTEDLETVRIAKRPEPPGPAKHVLGRHDENINTGLWIEQRDPVRDATVTPRSLRDAPSASRNDANRRIAPPTAGSLASAYTPERPFPLVGREGIEPPTDGLKAHCSAN